MLLHFHGKSQHQCSELFRLFSSLWGGDTRKLGQEILRIPHLMNSNFLTANLSLPEIIGIFAMVSTDLFFAFEYNFLGGNMVKKSKILTSRIGTKPKNKKKSSTLIRWPEISLNKYTTPPILLDLTGLTHFFFTFRSSDKIFFFFYFRSSDKNFFFLKIDT